MLLLICVCSLVQVESRKITQKPSKPDKSWVRSKIDWAKGKVGVGSKRSTKKPVAGRPKTTKKSLFERAKEKVETGGYVQKAVGFVKKDLGIGVAGPRKPSKILKYGKKAVDKLFNKKKSPNTLVEASRNARIGSGSVSEKFHERMEYLQNRLETMQEALQHSWNTSEAGTKYKLFEESKNWNDAQVHCEELGSHLAYLDTESKNAFATFLLMEAHNITVAWFGLRTEVDERPPTHSDHFSNFSSLDGCGVLDSDGSWSISTCSLELPFICQALRLNVEIQIPV
ncbi:unnamed protein product [Caenorhabditis sp. 36 PRJEB53466]|nr:unnamed protein product [Caenorhabditis sp. 36 PRJEB53466]